MRRFEILTYAQELLHDLLFVAKPSSNATGIGASAIDKDESESAYASSTQEHGQKNYFKTLEKKKRLEDLKKQELVLDDEEEASPGTSLLRNVIHILHDDQ